MKDKLEKGVDAVQEVIGDGIEAVKEIIGITECKDSKDREDCCQVKQKITADNRDDRSFAFGSQELDDESSDDVVVQELEVDSKL